VIEAAQNFVQMDQWVTDCKKFFIETFKT